MPWVRFSKNFDFRPPETPRVCIAYKAGTTHFVRRICAEQAIERGKAAPTTRPVNVKRRQGEVSRSVR